MVALGVKESVSGRRLALTAEGDEVRVCGGKGAVYLSGHKVALRCCAKATIVVTRRLKQSVLRQGDVGLLDLRDVFYANGTLTKYEVIDMDAGHKVTMDALPATTSTAPSNSNNNSSSSSSDAPPAAAVTTVAGIRVQATRLDGGIGGGITSRYFAPRAPASSKAPSPAVASMTAEATKQRSPQDVGDVRTVDATPTSRPSSRTSSKRIVVDDFSSDDDDEEAADDGGAHGKKEQELTPVKPRQKKTRVIVESDEDDDDDDEGGGAQGTAGGDGTSAPMAQSDVSSPPDEDDVYLRDLQLKQERAGSTNWMDAYARGSQKANADDGWFSVRDRDQSTARRSSKKKANSDSKNPRPSKRRMVDYDDAEDDMEADQHTRSHDEVGQILRECEMIAEKLRRSLRSWAGKPSSPSKSPLSDGGNDAAEETHVSLSAISSTKADVSGRVISQADIPDICATLELKPYQVVGLNWLLLLCENGLSGVLADEMGLGKTVQTIAFLLLLHSLAQTKDVSKYVGPHLVVVPASVLNNWKREFEWIAPTLRVIVYHGAKDIRYNLQDSLASDDFDIMLTTYTYFERDTCQDDRNFLRSFQFGYMILDEGHSIKNSKTSRFRRISAMRARNRLVLSGTPIQNNLNELLALLSFLMPKMFDHGSDELLSFFDGTEEKKTAKIRKILAPFVLRREKKYVLNQLVPKTIHVEMLKLDDTQRAVYTNLVESVIKQREADVLRKLEEQEHKRKNKTKFDRQVQRLLGDICSADLKSKRSEGSSDAAIFTQLRKAANHPVLLRNHYVSDHVLDTMSRCLHRAEAFGNQCSIAMVRKELESYSDFELHDLCVQYGGNDELRKLQLPSETILQSAKFDCLRTLLPQLKSDGHRVLIFSQWTKLLDLLEVLMSDMDYRYLRLDGSTDVAERQGLIDTYNQDKEIFVFLLSTRAGGLGINLTAADTVILHDLDFNPTNDEQACDRCHRIGQTKPVTIYKLVSENTVDHDIFKLGETKTQLNNAVLGKLNAHSKSKSPENVTVEMLLASVLSSYKK